MDGSDLLKPFGMETTESRYFSTTGGESGSGFFNETPSANLSIDLCAANSGIPLYQDISMPYYGLMSVKVVLFIYYSFILIVGVILGFVFIWLFIKKKKIRTLDSSFAFQIAILNIVGVLIYSFPSMVTIIGNRWVFGPYGCIVQGFIAYACFSVRSFAGWSIAIDCFCLMFSISNYRKYRAKIVTIMFVVGCFGSIGFSLIPLPWALDCYNLQMSGMTCYLSGACSNACSILEYANFFIVAIPTYFLPLVFYFVMRWKSEKSQTALNQNGNNVKRKIKKANKTFFLLYITYFVFTAPNTISIIVARTMATYGFTSEFPLYAFVFSHLLVLMYVMEGIVILRNGMVRKVMATAIHEISE